MLVRRLIVSMAVLSGLAAAGCSPDDHGGLAIQDAREAARHADQSTCPLHLDAPAALKTAGVATTVTFRSAEARVSKSDKPAADPYAAQQGGMSAIDANAAVYLDCDYRAGDDALRVIVVLTPARSAVSMLLPTLTAAAGISTHDAASIVEAPPSPDVVKIFGDAVALGGLPVEGGEGAILVSSELPGVTGDQLSTITSALIKQTKI